MKTINVKSILQATTLMLCTVALSACESEIKHGKNDIDNWPEVVDYKSRIQHPCMLHTEADFTFVKEKIAAGEQPWSNAFAHLCRSNNSHSQSNYVASPVERLARLDQNNWQSKYPNDWNNYTKLMRDAAAAYQLALRWKLSGDETYAKTGVKILNDWAAKCKGYIVNEKGEFIDPNEYLISIQIYQLANAAEVLRTYPGWKADDFTKYKQWMVDVFYPFNSDFLSRHNGTCFDHYWMNWDLAQLTAVLSIGILTEDNFKINQAIQYFKMGVGMGNILQGVLFTHQDPDSNQPLGQCQESGRDQGHATLCVSLLGVFCQMAKNIGEDLFAFADYRALSMAEYIGKYNIGTAENPTTRKLENFVYGASGLPYTEYVNCKGEVFPKMSDIGRGEVRPAWEVFYRYAQDKGRSAIYSKMWVDIMRQSSVRGNSDGGAGDYGPNSGGYDQLGFGTLMFAK